MMIKYLFNVLAGIIATALSYQILWFWLTKPLIKRYGKFLAKRREYRKDIRGIKRKDQTPSEEGK